MIRNNSIKYWERCVERKVCRLKEDRNWDIIPCLISISIVLILLGHLLPKLNPRLGNLAKILPLQTEQQQQDVSIWISIFPDKENIAIITSDRKIFTLPQKTLSYELLMPLQTYLKEKVRHKSIATGLSMPTVPANTTVILSVDQRLKYAHILPVIYSLAQANISRYGFETSFSE